MNPTPAQRATTMKVHAHQMVLMLLKKDQGLKKQHRLCRHTCSMAVRPPNYDKSEGRAIDGSSS
jgi:hypothetical protein